jgi:LPS export ABC transporter protein LptC
MTSSRGRNGRGLRRFGQGGLLRVLSFFVLVGLVAGGLWWYLTPPPPPPPAEPSPEEKAKMETLSLTQIEEGGQRWKLNAQKAEYLKNRDEIRIRGVYLEFYGTDQETVYLWGDEGLVNTKSQDLVIRGDVKLAKGNLTIRTPEIQYFHKERTLVAPEEVLLEGPQAQIAGKDLHLDLTRKRLLMKQHRLTTVKLEKGLL